MRSNDVTPIASNKGECQGNPEKCSRKDCPIFGTLMKPNRDGLQRIRGCGDPVARGKASKKRGQKRQAEAVRSLGIPRSNLHPGHEEFLGGTVRIEVKAGAQVGPIDTRYRAARAQSDAARALGDHRPFVFCAMPISGPGYAVIRLDELPEAIAALAEQLGMTA